MRSLEKQLKAVQGLAQGLRAAGECAHNMSQMSGQLAQFYALEGDAEGTEAVEQEVNAVAQLNAAIAAASPFLAAGLAGQAEHEAPPCGFHIPNKPPSVRATRSQNDDKNFDAAQRST